ncbi:MAG: hypothetical protein GSR80_001806 [Desulfurococcales archaeon]|nr:hypothetical protein [Desulfurococcales archaeon]
MSEEKPRKKRKKRMTLPKKREDLEKIVEEISETHPHEHHHHAAEGLDEILEVYEIFIDSLRANVSSLEAQVKSQRLEIARLYRILSKIVEACFSEDEEEKKRALLEAEAVLATAK